MRPLLTSSPISEGDVYRDLLIYKGGVLSSLKTPDLIIMVFCFVENATQSDFHLSTYNGSDFLVQHVEAHEYLLAPGTSRLVRHMVYSTYIFDSKHIV